MEKVPSSLAKMVDFHLLVFDLAYFAFINHFLKLFKFLSREERNYRNCGSRIDLRFTGRMSYINTVLHFLASYYDHFILFVNSRTVTK